MANRPSWLFDSVGTIICVVVVLPGCRSSEENPALTPETGGVKARQEVVTSAKRSRAELIVLGRAAEASGSPVALGSVARLVLWASPCPVVVLGQAASHLDVAGRGGQRSAQQSSLRLALPGSGLGTKPEPWPPAA